MRVLVTGGTGFTGKALALRLAREGHEVTALDCREGLRTDELRAAGVRVVLGSVADAAAVDAATAGVERVFHLAAAFRETGMPDRHYHEVNAEGTRLVAEAALRHGAGKLVYCSTCGVHGSVDSPPAGEDAPIRPRDTYQQTKHEGELVLAPFVGRGLPVTILRPAAIYGPGDPARFLMIFRRVERGLFPMFGDGRTLYHPLYIDNLVDAFLAVMEPGRGDGEAYLVADAEHVTIEQLVRAVASALGVPVRIPHLPLAPLVAAGHLSDVLLRPLGLPPPLFPRRVDWFRSDRAFRIEKARRELGWEPLVGLEEGLRRTAEWYRAHGYLRPAGARAA
jgi:nucleoside-diphosphate-sugar epimerase